MRTAVFLLAASACWLSNAAQAQDAPSLGDVARQARQQKQQKEAQSKPGSGKSADSDAQAGGASTESAGSTAHVISNENLFEHTRAIAAAKPDVDRGKQDNASNADDQKERAEQIKSAIQSQKAAIASLKEQIESVSNSIHYAGGNCVANCAQWNERQKQKQDEVETMKSQLEEQEKRLEDMQESARKQGFGSSVYEP
jgi:chromosome segregation ATPase